MRERDFLINKMHFSTLCDISGLIENFWFKFKHLQSALDVLTSRFVGFWSIRAMRGALFYVLFYYVEVSITC